MWLIDAQLLFLCIVMPPAGSYAVKYIYAGPQEADFTSVDLILNLVFTMCGFVPGVFHALYLFARHKGCQFTTRFEAMLLWLVLMLEVLLVRLLRGMAGWRSPAAPDTAEGAAEPAGSPPSLRGSEARGGNPL